MERAIVISKSPKRALNILNRNATSDLNKSVPKDFVGWVYMYVTKAKPRLAKYPIGYFIDDTPNPYVRKLGKELNGKVVARWWHDEYTKLLYITDRFYDKSYSVSYKELRDMCLDDEQLHKYGNGKDLYAWHIKKLEILEPMELGEFKRFEERTDPFGTNGIHGKLCFYKPLNRVPQSYQYVWAKERV